MVGKGLRGRVIMNQSSIICLYVCTVPAEHAVIMSSVCVSTHNGALILRQEYPH